MALEIKWSKQADRTFDKIIEYLRKHWGDHVVMAFVRKTYDFLDVLADFPEIGSMQLKEKDVRGFVIIKQVIVFYKIKGNSVILLSFFDCRQNPERNIPEE